MNDFFTIVFPDEEYEWLAAEVQNQRLYKEGKKLNITANDIMKFIDMILDN